MEQGTLGFVLGGEDGGKVEQLQQVALVVYKGSKEGIVPCCLRGGMGGDGDCLFCYVGGLYWYVITIYYSNTNCPSTVPLNFTRFATLVFYTITFKNLQISQAIPPTKPLASLYTPDNSPSLYCIC